MSEWKPMNEAQGATGVVAGMGQEGGGTSVQYGAYGQTGQQLGPAPGGFYQFQPGLGFVQVQGGVVPGMIMPGQGMAYPYAGGFVDQSMGQPTSQSMGQSPQAGMPGTPDGAEPKFDQNRFGEVYGMVNDVMNGEAEPAKLLGFLSGAGNDFWKGALVGAAAVFLLNNDAVKGAVAGVFGSVFGGQGGDKQE
ncbi:MAG: hypothetical protein AB7E32_08040 [Desulfovibrio sp.]